MTGFLIGWAAGMFGLVVVALVGLAIEGVNAIKRHFKRRRVA